MTDADTRLDLLIKGISARFHIQGRRAYFGEPVSQTEHALQAAALADRENAPDALVIAALLHDVGHLLSEYEENIADRGTDAKHEDLGYRWLGQHFGPEVTEPVRLHVDAKRYLCVVDQSYVKSLSPASVQSLRLQGGPMSVDETRTFRANLFYADALRLRHWDDEAKTPGLSTPGLEAYLDRLRALALG
jgi:phosphonate degradation associated HDIG domain protein